MVCFCAQLLTPYVACTMYSLVCFPQLGMYENIRVYTYCVHIEPIHALLCCRWLHAALWYNTHKHIIDVQSTWINPIRICTHVNTERYVYIYMLYVMCQTICLDHRAHRVVCICDHTTFIIIYNHQTRGRDHSTVAVAIGDSGTQQETTTVCRCRFCVRQSMQN